MNGLNYNLIMNSVTTGIIVTDTMCRVIYLNKCATDFLALDEKKAIGLRISEILESAEPIFKICIETGKPQLRQKIIERGMNIVGDITPIWKEKQIVGATYCFLKASKFNHRLESKLDKLKSYECLEEELEKIVNQSFHGEWLCDGEGTVLKVNETGAKLYNIKPEDIIGKKAWYLLEEGLVDRSVTKEVLQFRQWGQEIVQKIRYGLFLGFFIVRPPPTTDRGGFVEDFPL